MTCWHCNESAQSAALYCWCGQTAACSLCDGRGCRHCGDGWYASPDAPEAVEDSEGLERQWDWGEPLCAEAINATMRGGADA